jgi:maltooligosyltrehalose trehalohydrolase
MDDIWFGARLAGAGRARFRLWAPSAEAISIVVDGAAAMPMRRIDDGFLEADAQARAGSRYHFVLQDGTRVPDPASRAQEGGIDGDSIVVDPDAYSWRHEAWRGRPWNEAVVYELHAGLLGGFDGVRARLPELARLGVTAVQLMPVAQFPGERNWGYDGVLPYAPAAAYGAPEDMKRLVDEAHGLGLMVMLDVVYNHFGPAGNYLSQYAKRFFREDIKTPWGPAIDFRQRPVREFFIANALYWLEEFRLDGLRLDAVHAIAERGFLTELARRVHDTVGTRRHVHLVVENEHNDATLLTEGFTAQWNDDSHHVLHVRLTGEHEGYYAGYVDAPAQRLARWLEQGFVYQGEPMGKQGRPRGEPSGHLRPTAFINCLQNHDQIGNRAFGERLAALADPHPLRVAMALLLLCPQIPMLFMGEELASTTPFCFFTDYEGELADAVREGRRGEFEQFAAFSDPERRERIPDPNALSTFEQSRPAAPADPAWTPDWIAALLALRRQWIVPRLDGAVALPAQVLGPMAVRARWRMGDGAILEILVNLDEDAIDAARADEGAAAMSGEPPQVLHESGEGVAQAVDGGRLPPWSLLVRLSGALSS